MSNQVHAPYHFVPLSKWVYLPEWAHLVSHDHPLTEGVSGSIELSLTNKTPLLVGASTSQDSPSKVSWVKDPQGNPLIPGSSLKGMVRSFLEVASFSKFKQIDDNRFGYRDISGANTKYSRELQETTVQTAWLSYDSTAKQWFYRSCQHTRLYGVDFNAFLKKQKIEKTISNNSSNQTTRQKYEIWPLSKPEIQFELGNYLTKHNKPRECAVRLGVGKQSGHPVFVGYRPGKSSDLDLDFNYLFYATSDKKVEISTELVNQMFAAHGEELITYLKSNGHPKYGMPIFIRAQNGAIKALGLAKMPKKLYDSSITDLASNQQNQANNDASFDLCELIFGTLRDYGIGLKSRVFFSDAHCTNKTTIKFSSPVILGQPQASYLNAYLEQSHQNGEVRGELTDYGKGAKLAGWKRYPSQSKFNNFLPEDLKDKPKVQSQLELLDPNATFKGKVVFHNLSLIELGALLWSLNPNQNFCHGLGHGKSLGAGAVQLTAALTHSLANNGQEITTEQAINAFIQHMNEQHPAYKEDNLEPWLNSPQIQHLLAFGNQADNQNKNLNYMLLQKRAGDGAVTYSNSKVSGQRKALPSWIANGQALSRTEEFNSVVGYAPKGRLAELCEQLVEDPKVRESMEVALASYNKELKQQELEALKADASDIYKEFLTLMEHFEKYRGNTTPDANNQRISRAQNITEILIKAVEAGSSVSASEFEKMHESVTDFAFTHYFDAKTKPSKKAKPKYDEKKALIAQLKEKSEL